MKTSDYKSFAYLENGDIIFTRFETIKSTSKLDSGSYKLSISGFPDHVPVLKVDSDAETTKTHSFPEKEKIDKLLCSFFDIGVVKRIKEMGFYHKTGILLYGHEGTGKSTIIKYYYDKAIKEHDSIVFHMLCNDYHFPKTWEFVQSIRQIQDNPIIIVFDEFDQQMESNESYLKTVIDGNMSIDNCIFFASTNHLDKIPEAMKNRPSRFKYCLNIKGLQSRDDIERIAISLLGDTLERGDISAIADNLVGKPLDYIKQYCFDIIMDISHYENGTTKIGFK